MWLLILSLISTGHNFEFVTESFLPVEKFELKIPKIKSLIYAFLWNKDFFQYENEKLWNCIK